MFSLEAYLIIPGFPPRKISEELACSAIAFYAGTTVIPIKLLAKIHFLNSEFLRLQRNALALKFSVRIIVK